MPRTKAFEPEEALEKAMLLFWSKGYESASVQDLVEATGVNRFSLYETFGDKHQLFLAAIDRYAKTRAAPKIEKLAAGKNAREAIHEYFDGLVDELCSEDGRRGCFLLNCAVEAAPRDAKVAKRVAAHFKRLERAFCEVLRRSKNKGMPDKDGRLKRVASYLTCCAQGLIVMAKVNPSRKSLGGVVKTALRQIG